MLLNEAYVGKTKNLLEIEKLIHDIREDVFNSLPSKYIDLDYMGMNFYQFTGLTPLGLTSSKKWKRMEYLFEEQFGFSKAVITLLASPMPNMVTMPLHLDISTWPFLRKALIANKNYIKFDKRINFNLIMICFSGLFFNKSFTAGEVLAIMLHEVGHNFEYSVLNLTTPVKSLILVSDLYNKFFDTVSKGSILGAIFVLSQYTPLRWLVVDSFAKMQEYPLLQSLVDLMTTISMVFSININWFDLMLSNFRFLDIVAFKMKIKQILDELDKMLNIRGDLVQAITSYLSENFADSFVTLHGYGKEFISGFAKFNSQNTKADYHISKIPIVGHLLGLNSYIFGILNGITDGHPNDYTRFLTQLNVLEADLRLTPNMPKDTRKLVEKDTASIKDQLKLMESGKINKTERNGSPNYSIQTQAFLNRIERFFMGNDVDIRKKIMDKTYHGQSSIIKSLNKAASNPGSWF